MAARPRTPRSSMVAVAAFLRIYEPLEALFAMPAAERTQWRALSVSVGDADSTSGVALAAREHAAALRAATALPPRLVVDLDLDLDLGHRAAGALLSPAAADGVPRVCPADLGWRAILALEELRTRVDPAVLAAFIPPAVVADVARRLEELRASHPPHHHAARAPHVRSSCWHIPLTWFALFSPDQRLPFGVAEESSGDELGAGTSAAAALGAAEASAADSELAADAEPGAPSLRSAAPAIRYLAPMADARRCVARALAAVRRTPSELLPAAKLEHLGRWLEEFHARSVVELDFGALAGSVADAELTDHGSVGAVSAAVAALRAGAGDEALTALAAVRDRWAALRAFERAS